MRTPARALCLSQSSSATAARAVVESIRRPKGQWVSGRRGGRFLGTVIEGRRAISCAVSFAAAATPRVVTLLSWAAAAKTRLQTAVLLSTPLEQHFQTFDRVVHQYTSNMMMILLLPINSYTGHSNLSWVKMMTTTHEPQRRHPQSAPCDCVVVAKLLALGSCIVCMVGVMLPASNDIV
jgi:hypothetical protein